MGKRKLQAFVSIAGRSRKAACSSPSRGDRFDGHDFVEKAFEEGAAAVMVHRDIHCRGPYVRVANTREALLRLAGYYRQFFQIPVVGFDRQRG